MQNTIAFTGSRPRALIGTFDETVSLAVKVKLAVKTLVTHAYERGYRTFYTGMAQGWDTFGAEAVLELRTIYSDVRLIAAIPFMQQAHKWPPDAQERWQRIVKAADEAWVVEFDRQIESDDWETIQEDRSFFKTLTWLTRRNEWMVDRVCAVLGGWDGESLGTLRALQYARLQPHVRSIVIYYPANNNLIVERRAENGWWDPAQATKLVAP